MFSDNFFDTFIRRYFYYFDSYPLVIQIAIFLTVVSILSILVAYISIFYKRIQGYRREKKLARLNPSLDHFILEQVITNEAITKSTPVSQVELPLDMFRQRRFRKKWARQAIIDRMLHYRKNFAGDLGDLLRKMYIDLGLNKNSFNKLKSMRWDVKVKGLIEMTLMDIPIADVNILPLTNSKNRELRSAARHAYIKLSKNEPFKFFDIVTEPLLLWDQVELFKVITSSPEILIPNFAQWVAYSQNKSIVAFCLKLIVYYNQREAIPSIIQLLETKDHYLRAAAINALGKMKAEEAEDSLVALYSNQPHDCQLEILKALGRMSSGRHLGFLRNEFLRSTDFDVRKNAAKSIIKHDEASAAMLKELLETATAGNALILKHCMNPLIKY
jgi:hypothetical protein